MIDASDLKDFDFSRNYFELEERFISEIENLIFDTLIREGRVAIEGDENNVLEFYNRTNFKVRVKRPQKNVWSVPIQLLRDAIRKVLREGHLRKSDGSLAIKIDTRPAKLDIPVQLLLRIVPEQEYVKRSLVGNKVRHNVYGEGRIQRITETGNVEVAFKDKVVKLKPQYFQLVP
ncbi:MAG: hypothetical protein GXO78_09970 [Calditrichaeota bacterium]|nr:hypothetical protein [Calditrichota bacterium]